MLKNKFGKDFHIHLYAPPHLITLSKLKKLYNAGLDEIRFHPNLTNKKEWGRINLAAKFKWDIGIEIPVIPGMKKELADLIDFFKDKIDFLNLNELEISDTNMDAMLKRGFKPKDRLSCAVKGSEELAEDLLNYCIDKKFSVHYCTTKLKDKVQLANRIKRRAKNIAAKFDIINEDGTLFRGAVYLEKPGFDYRKKLNLLSKKKRNI